MDCLFLYLVAPAKPFSALCLSGSYHAEIYFWFIPCTGSKPNEKTAALDSTGEEEAALLLFVTLVVCLLGFQRLVLTLLRIGQLLC